MYQLARSEKKFKRVIALSAIMFISIVGIVLYGLNNEYLLARIQQMFDGSLSGREYIYVKLLDSWVYSVDSIVMLFGFGFGSSLEISQYDFAHNDWLEMLTNFGAFGIMIYLVLYVSMFYESILSKNHDQIAKACLVSIMMIWTVSSVYSMWYTSITWMPTVMLLGYLIGKNQPESFSRVNASPVRH
jgi:O-antigen ligase